MSAEFLSRIMDLDLFLHLRVREQQSAELPKEFSTLGPELHLREIPGKSVQRPRRRGRLDVLGRLEFEQPPRPRILRVSRSPSRLLGALALGLAGGLRARALPRAYTSVRTKPLSAEATRARPVRHLSADAHR
jgi:hypothetical protein